MGFRMALKNNLESVIQHLTAGGYRLDSVFDIGANKGNWTAHYTRLLPNAIFCMFEANPKHTRPGKVGQQHKWFNVVLSSPDVTEVEFYSIAGTGDSYYKEQTRAYDTCTPIKLPTITLDKMVDKHSLTYPQLVKLDTQGSELDILKGASKVIEHADIIMTEAAIMAYNKDAPNFDDYIKFFTERGYVPVGINEIQFADNILVQCDIVFLKKEIKTKYYGDKNFLRI